MDSILDRSPLEWMKTRVPSSAVEEEPRALNSTVVRPLLETEIDSDECIESAVIQISRGIAIGVDIDPDLTAGNVVLSFSQQGDRSVPHLPAHRSGRPHQHDKLVRDCDRRNITWVIEGHLCQEGIAGVGLCHQSTDSDSIAKERQIPFLGKRYVPIEADQELAAILALDRTRSH